MLNMLVVADDWVLRRSVTIRFAEEGYTVAEAEDVMTTQEALAVAAFDVVVLDIDLPDAQGWHVLSQFWESYSEEVGSEAAAPDAQGHSAYRMPVVVMSRLSPAVRRLCAYHPAVVLLKPFSDEALRDAVERVIGMSAETQPLGRIGLATCLSFRAKGREQHRAVG